MCHYTTEVSSSLIVTNQSEFYSDASASGKRRKRSASGTTLDFDVKFDTTKGGYNASAVGSDMQNSLKAAASSGSFGGLTVDANSITERSALVLFCN